MMKWERHHHHHQHHQPDLQSSKTPPPSPPPPQLPLLLRVLILTTAAAFLPASECHVRHGSLSSLPQNDDVLFKGDVLGEVPVRSRLECSTKCLETDRCAMATFYPNTSSPSRARRAPGLCRLFGQVHVHGRRSAAVQGRAVYWDTVRGARSFTRRCDPDYFISCGRCLKIIDEEVTYVVARQRCSEAGEGQLVMPQTLADVATVQQLLIAKGMTRTWVGASDLKKAGEYRWNDGTLLPQNSPLWCAVRGEPENLNPGNDCVRVQDNYPNLFDRSCLDLYPYTCQRDFL